MTYHIERYLPALGTMIYYSGKRMLNGHEVPSFEFDKNKAMIFDDLEEAKAARDYWGRPSRVVEHE